MPEIYYSGQAALISALYDELKIGQTIEEMMSWDQEQCHMSPGKRINVLMINIFGRKRSLYRIDYFYCYQEFSDFISENKYRFLVVYSYKLDGRKVRSLKEKAF